MTTFFLKNACTEVPSVTRWQSCIAKSPIAGQAAISVLDHSRCTAAMATALSEAWGFSKDLPELAAIAAIHDVGKISPGFQLKIGTLSEAPGAESSHTRIGQASVTAFMGATICTPVVAAIVGAHHGTHLSMVPFDDSIGTMGGAAWAAERRTFIQEMEREFGRLPADIPKPLIPVATGLIVLADWLASGFPGADPKGVLEKLGLSLQPMAWPGFVPVFKFEPNDLQAQALEASLEPSGLYLIDAPMGTGKTEAALALAGRFLESGVCRGLYFALPTMATANAMLARTQAFLGAFGTPGARIIHGQSWLNPTGGGELAPGGSWFIPTKRGLVFPCAVGTIDQALLSCMRAKHYQLRQAGLSRRVVIIDEVHSYDCYTGTLVNEMVKTLRGVGCPVIVMSATLTSSQKDQFQSAGTYTLRHQATGPEKHVRLSIESLSSEGVAIAATAAANGGAVVAVIANTVARAQAYYQAIAALQSDIPVGLIHSRLIAAERAARESHWLQALGKTATSRPGCILVGTQILEQSLDVDFDIMFSELAPIDLLLQRLGRLWRHPREHRPMAHPRAVVITANLDTASDGESLASLVGSGSAKIYALHLLWRTHRTLAGKCYLKLPTDITPLIEAVYDAKSSEPMFITKLSKSAEDKARGMQELAIAAGADAVNLPVADDDTVRTRLGSIETVPAVIASRLDGDMLRLITGFEVDVSEISNRIKTAAELALSLVPVPRYLLPRQLSGPVWLSRFLYQAVLLSRDEAGRLGIEQQDLKLRYDDCIGLVGE